MILDNNKNVYGCFYSNMPFGGLAYVRILASSLEEAKLEAILYAQSRYRDYIANYNIRNHNHPIPVNDIYDWQPDFSEIEKLA